MGARWSSFAKTFACTGLCLVAGYLTLAYAVDPYDSGRSDLLAAQGVRPQGPRTAAASRGRDPAFPGAIIGNSHIQLLEPERLGAATGIPFVQLSVPATGPGEQFVILDWFLRNHPEPRALVAAADEYWCTADPSLPNVKPFPYWLFARETSAYLRGLLRVSVAEEVVNRVGWLLRGRPERARPDGWSDYEPAYLELGYGNDPRRAAELEVPAPEHPEPGRAGPFPAAGRLAASLARVPAGTVLVLVFPPVYGAGLPRPGTPRAAADEACKAALTQAARRHGASAVVDWRRPRPELLDSGQFFDQRHYRHPVARQLADEIARAIREAGAPRG
jgi:hypothetical protein